MKRTTAIKLFGAANIILACLTVSYAPKLTNSNYPVLGWGLEAVTILSVLSWGVTAQQAKSKADRISIYLSRYGIAVLYSDLFNLPSLDISGAKLQEVVKLTQQHGFDEEQILALLAQK